MVFLSLKGRCVFFEWKQKVLRATAFSSWRILDGTESCGLMLVFQYVVDRISNGSFPTKNRKSVMEKVSAFCWCHVDDLRRVMTTRFEHFWLGFISKT